MLSAHDGTVLKLHDNSVSVTSSCDTKFIDVVHCVMKYAVTFDLE